MKHGKRWAIFDVETDGLNEPVHIVELAGQLMEGWEPIGKSFRMFLNHNVPIPPEVVAIHGYTQEFLQEHGEDPIAVHEAFREYTHDCPLVAHNLNFDWDRCIVPELSRLQVPHYGQRGFCSLMLSRRLVTETQTYRLEALKRCFQLPQIREHQADNDVLTLVELFRRIYRTRLESAGIDTFDSLVAFTRETPVAKCLARIHGGSSCAPFADTGKDAWYYLDSNNNPHGPLPAFEVMKVAGHEFFHVWREGMKDWVLNRDYPPFQTLAQSPAVTPKRKSIPALSGTTHSKTKSKDVGAGNKDAWYYLDKDNNICGPHTAREISQSVGLGDFYVCREGMNEWQINRNCGDFIKMSESPALAAHFEKKIQQKKTMNELLVLCEGLIADGRITTAEVKVLSSWLEDAGFVSEWPASEIVECVARILEDGVITKDEKDELKRLLQRIVSESKIDSSSSICQISLRSEVQSSAPQGSQHYTIINLKQGTKAWLEWRKKGIGASDAPAIMGDSPWQNEEYLLRVKCGPVRESFKNAAMIRGIQLEPEAREHYTARTGKEVTPACLQSCQYEWLHASVDGISANGDTVVEIKCGHSVYQDTAQLHGVPDYYYGQLQHILATTGLPSIDFWCYLPGYPSLLHSIPRDEDYIQRLLIAESEFWKRVQAMTNHLEC